MTFTRIEPTGIDTTESFRFQNVSVIANTITSNLTVNTSLSTRSIDVSTSANLGPVANLKITGGNANLVLMTDGAGNLRWDMPVVDLANTVRNGSQPNITSVGVLSGLAVNTGAVTVSVPATFTSNWNSSSTVFSAVEVRVTDTLSAASSTLLNLTVGGNSRFSVNKTGAVNANSISLTGNVNAAFVSGTLTTAAQPNITSVGQLSVLGVTSNITAGNLIISGGMFGALNGQVGAITPNTGTFTNVVVNNNMSVSGNITGSNANLGNAVRANFFIGDGGLLTNVSTPSSLTANSANFANIANTVVTSAQPNITSVGTLTSLAVTGNISAGNANLGNATRANFFIGNFFGTANSATTANSSNTANSATTAGTVTTNAQPNITSVGSLTSLAVTGNFTGNVISASLTKEKLNYFTLNTASSSATLDTNLGSVWWINGVSNMSDPFAVNFSNVPSSSTEITVFVVMVWNGATAKAIKQLQINGTAQTVKWLGNTVPSGTPSALDIYSFTLIPGGDTGAAWVATGQFSSYT